MNKREIITMYKRMLLTVVCLIPVFALLEVFVITNLTNTLKVTVYVVISLLTVALVEYLIYNKTKNKKD